MGHRRDLTGQTFGEWSVIGPAGNGKWHCKCSCGVEKDILTGKLTTGQTLSCGHNKLTDMIGQHFGEWEVLSYHGNMMWLCRCSCGVTREVLGRNLRNGTSTSCGHAGSTKRIDLTGQIFGELEVIEYAGDKYWWCRCSCNKIKRIHGAKLRNGMIKSCGHTSGFKNISGNRYGKLLVGKYIGDGSTGQEAEVCSYISSLNSDIQIECNKRGILSGGMELDIYIPSKRLAIEFNGNYWHSSMVRNRTYHQDKSLECEAAGIHLVNIFEYEWENEELRDKLKLYLKDLILGYENKVYARNCEIKPVSNKDEQEFLELNHLQGYINSEVSIGLWEGDRLLSVMTFGKPRFNRDFEWELLRYCTVHSTTVLGGAEKLFKYFVDEYRPKSIISYSDIGKFTGNIYKRLGMNNKGITDPGYVWVKGSEVKSRHSTQKQKLLSLGLGNYGNTEDEIMGNLGYYKIYNSGHRRYVWVP